MPPLETRTDSPGRLQKYPKIHVSTGEEASGSGTDSNKTLGPGIEGRGIPRGPRATRMGTGLSRKQEGPANIQRSPVSAS